MKGGMGKTKGTEYRVTLNTPKREWELGSGEEDTAKEWTTLLSNWIGLPKVDREQSKELRAVVKAQWMEVRIEVYKPDEISDEELARSNTIQKSVSSFTRSFTLTGRKKKAAAEAETAAAAAAATTAAAEAANGEEEGEEGEDEEEAFKWVYVALFSDHTLRQFENEAMGNELASLSLGDLVQASFLEDPDTYDAFRVQPESPTADAWVLCLMAPLSLQSGCRASRLELLHRPRSSSLYY